MATSVHEHVAAFTCCHVVKLDRPILFVCHDHDGGWQFLCGEEGHDVEDGMILCGECLMEKDSSLIGIKALSIGYQAERSELGADWNISALPEDEDIE